MSLGHQTMRREVRTEKPKRASNAMGHTHALSTIQNKITKHIEQRGCSNLAQTSTKRNRPLELPTQWATNTQTRTWTRAAARWRLRGRSQCQRPRKSAKLAQPIPSEQSWQQAH